MNKTKIIIESKDTGTFKMSEMLPGQICIISHKVNTHDGKYVMRTLSKNQFEVMLLDDFGEGYCWIEKNNIKVKEAPIGTKIILEVA